MAVEGIAARGRLLEAAISPSWAAGPGVLGDRLAVDAAPGCEDPDRVAGNHCADYWDSQTLDLVRRRMIQWWAC